MSKKFSELPPKDSLDSADYIPIVDSADSDPETQNKIVTFQTVRGYFTEDLDEFLATAQAQESARVSAENTRRSNETTRQSREATRESNEATRQANEATRQANEATREDAETGYIQQAKSWAVGTNGVARQGDATDNAKYYSQVAQSAAASIGFAKRYGVSGIGQQAAALTRIYDSAGMVALVGTDSDNSNVRNDFDNATPFMRRKCVGEWNLVNGKAQFRVNAYYGDADYTEDGTMGDYVAVECPICYVKIEDGQLSISSYRYSGYRPFDIFCRNHDANDTIPYYYLPAYSLALDENGHAVSLPGLDNEQGCYKELLDAARTYKNGALGNQAIIQPMAVNFYEWALFTVEFATQNCQSIMQGCASLRHSGDDRVTFVDSTHILTSNYYAGRVASERIAVIGTDIDINNANYLATHEIVSVTRCDASGQASSSGTHQLLEVRDLGRNYYTYDTTTEYRIAARPYPTGACNGVSTPSGSPVSNTDAYHPMKYRWRENIYSNQCKTIVDLFNKRAGTEDDNYSLEYYLLEDPTKYEPSANSKPDATDLETDKFVLLDVETKHENYVNGYIKSKKNSAIYPDIWIPHETSGASGTTYFADNASLVHSYLVRSVRLGGYWSYGASDGLSNFYGYNAPSSAYASFGADLCFAQ